MKRYKDYMDGVEASDTLHEKLKNLEEPKKKPQPWAKYGVTAAALVLVAGVGAAAWGLNRDGWGALMESFRPAAEVAPGIADIPAPYPNPDIATEDPNGPFADPYVPADRTGGGYELIDGEFASYYVLPYLNWADASRGIEADYSLAPPSAIRRDATWDDVRLFASGEKAMADHLLWDKGMNWSGDLWFLEDGTPCAAFLHAGGNGMSFTLEVMLGGKVPSCEVPPDGYKTSQWQGVEISALKNAGYTVEDGVKLNDWMVSLYSNGVGYKLTVCAADAERAGELCARFVRYAVDGGFSLNVLPFRAGGLPNKGIPPEAVPTANILHPDDSGYIEPVPAPDGVPDENSESFSCPYCADGTVHTHPYVPGVPAATPQPR